MYAADKYRRCRATQSGKTATIRRAVQLSERLASLGIMVTQLSALLELLENHSTVVLIGSRGAPIRGPLR